MATSQDFVNWVCGPELDPRFLAYLLRATRAYIRSLSSGAIHQTVYMPTVESFFVCAPSVQRQREMCRTLEKELSTTEQALAAAGSRVEAISTLVNAYATEAYCGPTTRHWGHQRLAQCADIVGGVQKTPDRAPDRNPVPYLTVRNVQRGWLDLTHVEKFEVNADELKRLRLAQGDILIVEGNGSAAEIGRNALFSARDEDWIHQNHVIRVRLRPEMAVPEFVSGFLNSAAGRAQMLEKARTTSGLYSLSVGKVGELEVPLPSVSEQRALADAL
jgi:type I restriction enzyme S subunit